VKTVTKNGECAGEHSVVETADGEKLVWVCDVCGADIAEKQIPEAASVYASAVQIANLSSKKNVTSFISEDGGFARIYGGASSTTFNLYTNAAGDVVTGQYLVLKYRVAGNGTNQQQIIFYTSTKNAGATSERDSLKLMPSPIEDPTLTWRTAVIDLSQAVGVNGGESDYVANGNGEYCAKFLEIRPFLTGLGVNSEDFMDISYMAFCTSLEDAVSMVDTTTYDYYTNRFQPTTQTVGQ
jgi:hypothetical protein